MSHEDPKALALENQQTVESASGVSQDHGVERNQRSEGLPVNACLLMVLLGFAAYAICVRLSPSAMRRWADYLNSRADAEEYWRQRFDRYRHEREQREA